MRRGRTLGWRVGLFVCLVLMLTRGLAHAAEGGPGSESGEPPGKQTEDGRTVRTSEGVQVVVPVADAAAGGATRVSIGWDGFDVRSPGDAYALEAHMYVQLRGEAHVMDGELSSLDGQVFRARPLFRMHLWHDRVVATLQAELVGGPRILEAQVDVHPAAGWRLSGGQMVVPFTRAWIVPLAQIEGTELSENNTVFAPSRRLGAYVLASPLQGKVQVWAGLFHPLAPDALREGIHIPMGLVRVQVNPLGALPGTELPALQGPAPTRVGVGLAALSTVVPDEDGVDRIQLTSTADLAVQGRGMTLYGEGFVRWSADQLGWGASGQLGEMLVPKHLHLTERFTAIDEDVSDTTGPRWTPEVVLGGFFHGTHALIDLRYGVHAGGGLPLDHVVTLQGQLRI